METLSHAVEESKQVSSTKKTFVSGGKVKQMFMALKDFTATTPAVESVEGSVTKKEVEKSLSAAVCEYVLVDLDEKVKHLLHSYEFMQDGKM